MYTTPIKDFKCFFCYLAKINAMVKTNLVEINQYPMSIYSMSTYRAMVITHFLTISTYDSINSMVSGVI